MSEFFSFTVNCIYTDFVQRIDFDRLEDARAYYDRHIYDKRMCLIELVGFSCLLGSLTILSSPRLDKPKK
jgi:hypothetical protein